MRGDGSNKEPGWRAFTPEDSPKTPDDFADDPDHADRHTTTLAVGDRAYGFARPRFEFLARSEPLGTFDLLRAAADKPVVLAFGSHT